MRVRHAICNFDCGEDPRVDPLESGNGFHIDTNAGNPFKVDQHATQMRRVRRVVGSRVRSRDRRRVSSGERSRVVTNRQGHAHTLGGSPRPRPHNDPTKGEACGGLHVPIFRR